LYVNYQRFYWCFDVKTEEAECVCVMLN
jgi:hypothetical protein